MARWCESSHDTILGNERAHRSRHTRREAGSQSHGPVVQAAGLPCGSAWGPVCPDSPAEPADDPPTGQPAQESSS